jgi:hypothetical protein
MFTAPTTVCGGGSGGGGYQLRQCPDSTEGPASTGFGSEKTTSPLPSPTSPLKGLGREMNIFLQVYKTKNALFVKVLTFFYALLKNQNSKFFCSMKLLANF